jgi:hypothetical protein
MGFWYPGMHGVFNPGSLTGPWFAPIPVLYTCEVCQRNFPDLEVFRRHRFEQHPLRQPTLLVRGRPVTGAPLKVQSALSPGDVIVEDATSCWVDGQSTTADSLRLLLADATTAFHRIRLSNDGAQTEVLLDFQVAKEADLVNVERALLRLATGQRLSLEAIGSFIHECRDLPTGMMYCDGIAHYLYGVMAKEQVAGTSLDFASYPARYAQAVDQLTDINRPVARSVRALVSFHFNHFLDAEALAPTGVLKRVAGAFAGLLNGTAWLYDEQFEDADPDIVSVLLTDQVTLELLRDAGQGLSSLLQKTDILRASVAKMSAGYDRSKRLLLAVEALSHRDEQGSRADARKLMRELLPQEFSRVWCEVISRRLKTK